MGIAIQRLNGLGQNGIAENAIVKSILFAP